VIGASHPLLAGAVAFALLAVATGWRALRGPTLQDRVIAVNAMGTSTIVVVVLVGAAVDEPGFVDVALVYGLLNFLLSIGVARFLAGRGEPA
jgi:multicomponent Na+:H+ antiporter subunit F